MRFADDLFVGFGPRRIRLVTAQTVAETHHFHLDVRVLRVRLTGSVAGFAGNVFVREFRKLDRFIGMALLAALPAPENKRPRSQFRQRRASIPAIVTKRGRLEKIACQRVTRDNADQQQEQAQQLRRHFKEAAHDSDWDVAVGHSSFHLLSIAVTIDSVSPASFTSLAELLSFFAIAVAEKGFVRTLSSEND
jgi:hypothetical protein